MWLSAWLILTLPICQAHPWHTQRYPSFGRRMLEAAEILEAAIKHSQVDPQSQMDPEANQRPAEPPRPMVPPRFKADVTFATDAGAMVALGPGVYAQDATKKIMRLQEERVFLFGRQYFTQLAMANSSYAITGGNHSICRQLPFGVQKFVDLFSWAANPQLSEYVGERAVTGRRCSQWQLRGQNHSMSLCADGNIPLELNMTLSVTGVPGSSSFQFSSLVIGQVPETLFSKPAECNQLRPPCESGRGKAPISLDTFVFHPGMSAADYNIEDQDIADMEGDAAFICGDRLRKGNVSSHIDFNYTLISHYSLQISPAFGQYGFCSGYTDTRPPGPSCIGGDLRLVGREAPFFDGDGESRCAEESFYGFWYSLPKGGRCPAGLSPSRTAATSGCTWSIQKRLKTIQQKCLLGTHHFVDSCKADLLEKQGLRRSVAALRAAFQSEDVSAGGCPDVGGPDAPTLVA